MTPDKETNYRYWLANTVRASLGHCSRLAALCGCAPDAGVVTAYITDIAGGKRRGAQSSPFPPVLLGRLRGRFQPKHLMLKFGALRDASAGITYEFLAEYGIFEPSTGIYFGVKAVSDREVSDDAFITQADRALAAVAEGSRRLFSGSRLRNHPLTDNAENGTYWPLWLPNPGHRDLRDDIRLLQTIFRHFKKTFPDLTAQLDIFDDYTAPSPSPTPLAALTEKIATTFGSAESAELFTRFLEGAAARGILADCGDGRYRFSHHWALNSRKRPFKMTQKAAFDLMVVLFAVLAERYGVTRSRYIPWKQLRDLFRAPDSRPFDDAWQRHKAPSADTPEYRRDRLLCLTLMRLPTD